MLETKVLRHTTRAPQVEFEVATNGIQLYAIANLEKTKYVHTINAERINFVMH